MNRKYYIHSNLLKSKGEDLICSSFAPLLPKLFKYGLPLVYFAANLSENNICYLFTWRKYE
jgi:hypothetical protein